MNHFPQRESQSTLRDYLHTTFKNGIPVCTEIVKPEREWKTPKEKTAMRLQEETSAIQKRITGNVRYQRPPRQPTSLNTNETYLMDYADASPENANAHESAIAICEGWAWRPWKGMPFQGKLCSDRLDKSGDWEFLPYTDFSVPNKPSYVGASASLRFAKVNSAALNELFVESQVSGDDTDFSAALYQFAKSDKRVRECRFHMNELPEMDREVDDVFTEFFLCLKRGLRTYTHEGKIQNWITYIWKRSFFPEVQTKIGKRLDLNTFTSEDDKEEFQNNSVAMSAVETEAVERQNEGYAYAENTESILWQLYAPGGLLSTLNPQGKFALKLIADGLTQEEIAERLDVSVRQVGRYVSDAKVLGRTTPRTPGTLSRLIDHQDEDESLNGPLSVCAALAASGVAPAQRLVEPAR